MLTLANINDVKIIEFPQINNTTGSLEVFSLEHFNIVRVFTVHAKDLVTRGAHAHYACNQILVCSMGSCEVTCKDGSNTNKFTLDKYNIGLLVPCSIWAEQQYLSHHTTLMVLCDKPYQENDYIRNYSDYLNYRKT